MTVGRAGAGGGAGVAVERAAQVLAILVAHHGELEVDRLDSVELCGGLGHPPLDLALERTARHGQRDQHADDTVVADRHTAQHAEVDDRAVQLGVLDWAQSVDDLFFGHGGGHESIVATGGRICTTRIGTIAHMSSSPSFTATVSAITDAFGDPTRRSIYLYAKEHSGADDTGVTASMVAGEVGVHANVARHHLDKLAAGGYLEVVSGKVAGAGAGRPSKRYVVVGDSLTMSNVDFPVRSDDLLLSLLGRALDRLPNDEAEMIAEEVGQEYGRAMAEGMTGDALASGRRSLRSAMQAVADALTAHGFAAHAEGRNDQLRIINNHCPFGDVATDHPVICAVDRGMVKGMLAALVDESSPTADVVTESSFARGDTFCSTSV